jgi:hypothetical protein
MLQKALKILDKIKPVLIDKPQPAVVCLNCGVLTVKGEKCCDKPMQLIQQYNIEY